MKKILIYLNVLIAASLLLVSCDDFLDVNDDPNNPTKVTPDLVLPSAQKYTANIIQGSDAQGRRINTLGNMLMYNWSQSDGYAWYPDEFKYNVTSSFYQTIFNDSYTSALKQYQVLLNLTDTKYDYYRAIAMIMKAYHFQLLVDMYGDIPYFDALQRSNEATPKYDDAQVIYEDLITQLTSAIALIKGAELQTAPGDDDAMFQGDMTRWIQFANTVKIRILVRQSGMASRATYIQNEINEIVGEGSGFISTDVGINPGYIEQETDKQNPMWNMFGKDASGSVTTHHKATCATDYILTYLTNTNDPRIDYIYEIPSSTGIHKGVPQGLLDYDTPIPDQYAPEKVSLIGTGILKGGDMDATIFTLAEHYFNLAELAERGFWTLNTASSSYENGITASFAYLGVPSPSSYYSQPLNLVSWGSSANKIQAIITQKWIAVNGITAEQSWFDYNRTGYPAGLPVSLQASTPDRPVRLFYPSGETTSNGDNIPIQPNAFTEKIFWAK